MSYNPRYEKGQTIINDAGYILRIDSVTEEGQYLSTHWNERSRKWLGTAYRDADWVDRKFSPYLMRRRNLVL